MKIFLIFVLIFLLNNSKVSAQNDLLEIDTKDKEQEIEGFGVSGAWWSQNVGGWSQENRDEVLNLLFDLEKGIGINIYRYNIGAGAGEEIKDNWRNTETFEIKKDKYDWNRDKNAIKIMEEAQAKGVNNIVAFVNSPPARMTKSNSVTGAEDGSSNLKEEMYEDFSQYLIEIVKYLKEEKNLKVKWLSPINEPQWDWNYKKGQEGCHYEAAEINKLLKILLPKLKAENLNVGVSVVDAGEWKTADQYMQKLFSDQYLNKEIGHFAVHSYWSDEKDKEFAANYFHNNYPEKSLWMSEWTEMKEGRDYGMDSALNMANVIHADLKIAKVSSWQYWIAVSKYDYRDGLIYTDPGSESIETTKRLWVLGNYSRFIRPGYNALKITDIKNKRVRSSAYLSKDQKTLVIVVINNSDRTENISLNILNNNFREMKIFRTSKSEDLELVYEGKANQKQQLSALSVTTFILN